jgi:threonine dehydrogenase-like Zn-dependent dehydrogenase
MRRACVLAVAVGGAFPGSASAYVECGDPPGTAKNVTAADVSCADAREFARKVARRGVTRSGWIALPGWHEYYGRVRRAGGEYDVRATRGQKVIRFQYVTGGSGRTCDRNYAGACLDPSSSDYDCEGGSGDGPDYTGFVRVVGDDHFALDRDGDGMACE